MFNKVYKERFENTTGIIRSRKSKIYRHNNGQQKTKDRVTTTPLKGGGDHMCSGREGSSCPTCGTRRNTLVLTYAL